MEKEENIKNNNYTCPCCHGTGIYVGAMNQKELAIICSHCHGKGYFSEDLNQNSNLIEVDGIKYVIYGHGGLFTLDFLLSHEIGYPYLITYEDFLNGEIPLPIEEYTCPRQITQLIPKERFDNNCGRGCYSDCEKFGKEECWNIFYENARTKEEKAKVLKRTK